MSQKKHIVIIGAGFAGLRLARSLNNNPNYQVTLIDKNNYHQFQPLLYQVATANLDASNVSFPLRNIFLKSRNVKIRITEVNSINEKENQIETSTGIVKYDFLIIATGAETNYFGNKNMQLNTFPMKSTTEALQLRNQLIQNFEEASVSIDEKKISGLLTVVIVGGGPTGVELSGALADMKRNTFPKEYPELDFNKMKVYLLEGSDKILGSMSSASSLYSKKQLEAMGVLVKIKSLVKDYDGKQVTLQDGKVIPAELVIWTAGVKGAVLKGINKEAIVSGNRYKVDSFHKIINSKNIFAIGDIAFMESPKYPKGFPQLANVAIDQAKNLATNFKRIAKGKIGKEYDYENKGSMATVGRNKAVVDLARPHVSFQGFVAWFIWMTIHLFLLMGFRNRVIVFINWVYQYFTQNQSFTLLVSPILRRKESQATITEYEKSEV